MRNPSIDDKIALLVTGLDHMESCCADKLNIHFDELGPKGFAELLKKIKDYAMTDDLQPFEDHRVNVFMRVCIMIGLHRALLANHSIAQLDLELETDSKS